MKVIKSRLKPAAGKQNILRENLKKWEDTQETDYKLRIENNPKNDLFLYPKVNINWKWRVTMWISSLSFYDFFFKFAQIIVDSKTYRMIYVQLRKFHTFRSYEHYTHIATDIFHLLLMLTSALRLKKQSNFCPFSVSLSVYFLKEEN